MPVIIWEEPVAAGAGGLVLLALSGWFLTAAALAGASGAAAIAAFNYLIPSAAIRGLAVVRTAARYGERLWSHEAALRALAFLKPGTQSMHGITCCVTLGSGRTRFTLRLFKQKN